MPPQNTAENGIIASGGRASPTPAAASLGTINLGHFLPDYTAYEELLGAGQVAAGDAAIPAEAITSLRIEVLVASGRLDRALDVARPLLGRRGATNWTAVEAAAG